jgi:hypothetical protein
MVSAALLAVLLAVSFQLLSAVGGQWRVVNERVVAAKEASNLMERLTAQSFSHITPEAAKQVELSPEVRSALKGAELAVEVSEPRSDKDAKQIRIEIRWQDRAGRRLSPVGLVAWKYRGSEAGTRDRGPGTGRGK